MLNVIKCLLERNSISTLMQKSQAHSMKCDWRILFPERSRKNKILHETVQRGKTLNFYDKREQWKTNWLPITTASGCLKIKNRLFATLIAHVWESDNFLMQLFLVNPRGNYYWNLLGRNTTPQTNPPKSIQLSLAGEILNQAELLPSQQVMLSYTFAYIGARGT